LSRTANFTYLVSVCVNLFASPRLISHTLQPYEAIQARARKDRTTFSWFFDDTNLAGAAVYARNRDATIVFLQSWASEGSDRPNATALHNGDALVQAVAAVNKNTIVVVHSVGPLIIEPWITHPNVTAVLWAGLAGPETGNAVTDVLYGAYNPSARLPYTIAKNSADYPAQISQATDIPYSEALNIDYRHFDAAGIAPRFEFGFGLSYTDFAYSGLSIKNVSGPVDDDEQALDEAWAAGEPGPTGPGSSTAFWLHRPAFEVSFSVENTGDVAGTEVHAAEYYKWLQSANDAYRSHSCTCAIRRALVNRPRS